MKFVQLPGQPLANAASITQQLNELGVRYGARDEVPWLVSTGFAALTPNEAQQLSAVTFAFMRFLTAVYEAIKQNNPVGQAIIQELGGSPQLTELLLRSTLSGEVAMAMLRLDCFWDTDGRLIVNEAEEMIGGLGMSSALHQVYGQNSFSGVPPVYAKMVMAQCAAFGRDQANPKIAVVNPAHKGGYNGEFVILSQYMAGYGIHMSVVEPHEVCVRDRTVTAAGQEVDMLHRFFRLSELQAHYAQTDAVAQLSAVAAQGLVPMVQAWRELLANKALFAFFQMPEYTQYWLNVLGQIDVKLLTDAMPKTFIANPANAGEESLRSVYHRTGQKTAKHWLKRASDAWGGQAAHFGRSYSTTKWHGLMDAAYTDYERGAHWIVQEHHGQSFFPVEVVQDGALTTLQKARLRICPFGFFVDGEFHLADVMFTAREDDKVHGATNSTMFPAVIQD